MLSSPHVARHRDGVQPLLGAKAGDPHGLGGGKDLQVQVFGVEVREILQHLQTGMFFLVFFFFFFSELSKVFS